MSKERIIELTETNISYRSDERPSKIPCCMNKERWPQYSWNKCLWFNNRPSTNHPNKKYMDWTESRFVCLFCLFNAIAWWWKYICFHTGLSHSFSLLFRCKCLFTFPKLMLTVTFSQRKIASNFIIIGSCYL